MSPPIFQSSEEGNHLLPTQSAHLAERHEPHMPMGRSRLDGAQREAGLRESIQPRVRLGMHEAAAMIERLDDIPVSAPLANIHDSGNASFEGLLEVGKPLREQGITRENLNRLISKTIQVSRLKPVHVTHQQELSRGI